MPRKKPDKKIWNTPVPATETLAAQGSPVWEQLEVNKTPAARFHASTKLIQARRRLFPACGELQMFIHAPSGCRYTDHERRSRLTPPQSEVRLPQGLRFTDARRSAIGNYTVARSSSRAPKSGGCCWLRPPSSLLFPMRLPLAAAFLRSNLRSLLGRNSRAQWRWLLALRRYARPGGLLKPLPRLPHGSPTVHKGCGLWALRRRHARGDPRA